MKRNVSKTWLLTTLLFIFCLGFLSAQDTEADIYYKDGKSFSGYGRLLKNNKVKFKRTKETKSLKVSFKLLDSVVIHTENGDFLFKEVKVEKVKKPIVLEVLVTGKANLYGNTTLIMHRTFTQNGNTNFTSSTKKVGYDKTQNIFGFNSTRTTDFLLQMPGDKEPKFLPLTNPLSSNFKKTTSEIFNDCPDLLAKIQSEEFKKKDMVEVVIFYNEHCK